MKAAHPEDTERVRENIVGMSAGQYKEFSLQYRSRTKWDQDWQTLIVTGLPSERDKKGKRHSLYRYRFQQYEVGKNGSGTERDEG